MNPHDDSNTPRAAYRKLRLTLLLVVASAMLWFSWNAWFSPSARVTRRGWEFETARATGTFWELLPEQYRPHHVVHLTLKGQRLDRGELRDVAACHHLEGLDLSRSNVDDATLAFLLGELKQLQFVQLDGCPVTSASLPVLESAGVAFSLNGRDIPIGDLVAVAERTGQQRMLLSAAVHRLRTRLSQRDSDARFEIQPEYSAGFDESLGIVPGASQKPVFTEADRDLFDLLPRPRSLTIGNNEAARFEQLVRESNPVAAPITAELMATFVSPRLEHVRLKGGGGPQLHVIAPAPAAWNCSLTHLDGGDVTDELIEDLMGVDRGVLRLHFATPPRASGEAFSRLAAAVSPIEFSLAVPNRYAGGAIRWPRGATNERKALEFAGPVCDDQTLTGLASLPPADPETIRIVGGHGLGRLSLTDCPVTDDGLKAVAAIPSLSWLTLCRVPFSAAVARSLRPGTHVELIDCPAPSDVEDILEEAGCTVRIERPSPAE